MLKPNGRWRFVIDHRHLNSQVADDPFFLPAIEDMIKHQGGNALLSVFNMEDGSHQMHLSPESRQYTAFVTPWGVCKAGPVEGAETLAHGIPAHGGRVLAARRVYQGLWHKAIH